MEVEKAFRVIEIRIFGKGVKAVRLKRSKGKEGKVVALVEAIVVCVFTSGLPTKFIQSETVPFALTPLSIKRRNWL